jgi:hypothetical protein
MILGIPSLLVCVGLTAFKIDMGRSKPDPSAQSRGDVDLEGEGIVGLVHTVVAGIVTSLGFIAKGLDWAAGVLAIVAGALALSGASLFFTGRGLLLHQTWARVVASLATLGLLLISFLVMTSLRRGGAVAVIPIGMSVYMLWVLIRRFN